MIIIGFLIIGYLIYTIFNDIWKELPTDYSEQVSEAQKEQNRLAAEADLVRWSELISKPDQRVNR